MSYYDILGLTMTYCELLWHTMSYDILRVIMTYYELLWHTILEIYDLLLFNPLVGSSINSADEIKWQHSGKKKKILSTYM
jgi:hypothetical protein